MVTMINRLKFLWKDWEECFEYWWILQFPHLNYSKWEYSKIYELDDAFWFWFALNGNEWYLDESDE
jgi:hypothetical protein